MATLTSPGVSVTFQNDTSYNTSGTGTVPLIIMGTHSYKTTPSGATATGTIPSNAGVLTYCSSQRDVIQYYGNPIFYTSNGTALDGYELNEYGLSALYQASAYAGCYVLRAPIDYSDLVPTTTEPRGEPSNGTIWLNPLKTSWGIYQSNGSEDLSEAWSEQTPSIINDTTNLELSLIGNVGFADTTTAIITADNAGNLVINNVTFSLVTSDTPTSIVTKINAETSNTNITASLEYITGVYKIVLTQPDVTKTLTIDYDGTSGSSTEATLTAIGLWDSTNSSSSTPVIRPLKTVGSNGDFSVVTYYSSNIVYQKVISIKANDPNSSLSTGIWYIVGSDEWVSSKQNSNKVYSTTSPKIPSNSKSGDVWFNVSSSGGGINYYIQQYNSTTGVWSVITANVYQSLASMLASNPKPATGTMVVITPYVIMNTDNTGKQSTELSSSCLLVYNGSYWTGATYTCSDTEPTTEAEEGTYWYNNSFNVDIMINQSGDTWVGYQNYYPNTDPNGPILSGSQPSTQSNGNPLVEGDIWIDTSDTENYPLIYRFKSTKNNWVVIDNTDHITPSGIVFADARQDNGSGDSSVSALLVSNFVDPDAPNPELYPDGTLLFNTRYSTNNIKEYHPYYFTKEYGAITENGVTSYTDYTSTSYTVGSTTYPKLTSGGRWVTISGNNSDGSPKMGRHAQRALIVKSLRATINANQDILSETFYYSLIACPGYPELIDDMVTVSDNINNRAFVVGDTPARLRPTSSDISTYLSSTSVDEEFSLTNTSEYLGVYYPWGRSENVDGSTIVVPPSTLMLRTIINSDSISYPWYPPAGYTRGLIDNASNVGYIDPTTGSYTVCVLNQTQRDLLYSNNINPIAYMSGTGIVAYGQKTRSGTSTAMDRINVSRLTCYLAYQLEKLAKPFLFELNTSSTRANVKTAFDKFMANLVTLNAISDYLVVCDTTNNTDSTIDANELWIEIFIICTKTVEFIYIPVRLENTGTDLTSLV